MTNRKPSKFNDSTPPIVPLAGDGEMRPEILSLFDPTNQDVNLLNSIDSENIRLSGSKLQYYAYEADSNYDDVFQENRLKSINPSPKIVWGHYDPRPIEENLTDFGIELTNDQTFTFNKNDIESALRRPAKPGDLIRPAFQNLIYEIYEVQEDRFEVYGVYHLVCSARLLRDRDDLIQELDTVADEK